MHSDPIAMLVDAVSDYAAGEIMGGRTASHPEIRVTVGASWTVEVCLAGRSLVCERGAPEPAARDAREAFLRWVDGGAS